jgi:hypothetical protein
VSALEQLQRASSWLQNRSRIPSRRGCLVPGSTSSNAVVEPERPCCAARSSKCSGHVLVQRPQRCCAGSSGSSWRSVRVLELQRGSSTWWSATRGRPRRGFFVRGLRSWSVIVAPQRRRCAGPRGSKQGERLLEQRPQRSDAGSSGSSWRSVRVLQLQRGSSTLPRRTAKRSRSRSFVWCSISSNAARRCAGSSGSLWKSAHALEPQWRAGSSWLSRHDQRVLVQQQRCETRHVR